MRYPIIPTAFAGILMLLLPSISTLLSAQGDEAERLLRLAQHAAQEGRSAEAVQLLTDAIEQDSPPAFAYYLRGREHFRLSKITDSVADFDQFVKLRPDLEPRQWERGLSYYYDGKFKQGAQQFELYQTYHDNDVENSVWRYACLARVQGRTKARETILPIQNDPRVPMMEIYDLFCARLSVQAVLDAARDGQPTPEQLNNRLFYAHFYIGLFFEAEGDAEKAKKHILTAERHSVSHYMWDVARHHASLLRKRD